MIQGWRTSLHRWSRQYDRLKRLACGWVVGSFVLSLLIIGMSDAPTVISADPIEQARRQEWLRLQQTSTPQPREWTTWLRRVVAQMEHLSAVLGVEPTTWESFQSEGHLVGFEARDGMKRHATHADQPGIWLDFLAAALDGDTEAFTRLQAKASQAVPPPTANELLAALQRRMRDETTAREILMREARLFPDAQSAREETLRQALRHKDEVHLREIAADRVWLEQMPPLLQFHAGHALRDPWLQWNGLLRHRLQNLPYEALGLACFVALLWYGVFVLNSRAGRWRWLWPLPPLAVGVISVWPVLSLAAWQEITLGMSAEAPFPQDLWYYIAGVGLREEACKLAFVSLLMPWLLWRHQPGLALMAGAFVGLGFALEENITYYEEYGGAVALVRFFTANFLHAALTGIASHALYHLLRSRFATAETFLITFLGVTTVHGLYNYAAAGAGSGLDFFGMMLLAFTAWHFLDRIDQEAPASRSWITPAALFLLGTALLISWIFLRIAFVTPDRQKLVEAAAECLSVLPLAFIYWRRLR